MPWFLIFAIAALCVAALVFLIQIPIMIAKGRGICCTELTTIVVLSWCGIFLGVTWVVALILALAWPSGKLADGSCVYNTPELLDKLNKLKHRGIITQKEFESEKKKILNG